MENKQQRKVSEKCYLDGVVSEDLTKRESEKKLKEVQEPVVRTSGEREGAC